MAKRVFKTKKVLSGVRSEYRAWKLWEEGDVIVCRLVGSQPNRKNKSKKDWLVEPLEVFFSDKKEEKRIKAAKRVTLNSAGQLDKGMDQIEEGEIVQVTYKGQQEIEGGTHAGEMAHMMEVVCVEEDDGSEDVEEEEEDAEEEDDL